MITNFSEEHIEIGGTNYTLFLNRKGIVSWENITKASKKASEMENKYKNIVKPEENEENEEAINVEDNANPFDFGGDDLEEDEALLRDIYIKFYWIALYTNYELSLSKVTELFEKAEAEYGIEQLILLANKMLEDANTDKNGNKKLKKLEALNQTK